MAAFAIPPLQMLAGVALSGSIASGSVSVVGGLLGAVLSDRYGRKPLMIWPRIAFLIATWPAFWLMVRNHDAVTLLGATAFMAAFSSLTGASVIVGLTESMHKDMRGAGLGTIYATAVAGFGGTTQP